MKVSVRTALPSDQKAIVSVRQDATDTLRATYFPKEAAIRSKASVSDSLHTLVAEVDAQILGTVQYRIADGILSIIGLSVSKNARRNGIARALVERLVALAADDGISKLSLWCVKETGNPQIFERLGFYSVHEENSTLFASSKYPSLTEVRMEMDVARGV